MVHSVRPWLIAVLALPVVSGSPSGFDVRVKEGLVTIDARAVPLSDVLDQLGHQTGMKVVYETGRPRQIVTASMEGLPQPVALTKLLEGLGVGYSFSLDATQTRVETLIISISGATGPATATLARPPSGARPFDNGGQPRVEAEADASQLPDEETPEPATPEPEQAVAGAASGGLPSFPPFTNPTMPQFPAGASIPLPLPQGVPAAAGVSIPLPLPQGVPAAAGLSIPLPLGPRPVIPTGASNPQPPP